MAAVRNVGECGSGSIVEGGGSEADSIFRPGIVWRAALAAGGGGGYSSEVFESIPLGAWQGALSLIWLDYYGR